MKTRLIHWIATALAAGLTIASTTQIASARSGPNPFPRKVLPVTSGASHVPDTQVSTGMHDARRSYGAAHLGRSERPGPPALWGDPPGTPGAALDVGGRAPSQGSSDPGMATTRTTPSLNTSSVMAVPVPLPAGAVQIDSTYYDLQDMGSLGQRIIVGPDGRIHVTWQDDHCNYAPGGCPPNPSAPIPYPLRGMGYAFRDATGWHSVGRVEDPDLRQSCCASEVAGGFGTIALTANGRAVVSQHTREDGCDLRGNLFVQDAVGGATWTGYLPPIASPSYLFPQAAVLPNGSMLMLGEIPISPPDGFYEGTSEFRTSRLAAEGTRFVCPTGWQMGPWTQIVAPTVFRDGHGAFPTLAASSNGRAGVAVTDFGGNVFLIESSNGTFATGTVTLRTLTNYSDTAIIKSDSTSTQWRPYIHCHLAYQDTTPHVVWSELQARKIGTEVKYFDWRSRIRHWSSTTGLSTVKQVAPGEADTFDDIDNYLDGPLAGFNTISVDWPQVGFSPDGFETYVVWLRFTDSQVDTTAIVKGLEGIQTGTGYGDIACSTRRNGASWSAPQNLTQTPQTDERFVSLATLNDRGNVRIAFQASATNQAGVAAVGDRGGECVQGNCPPLNLVRRIAFLERHLTASVVAVGDLPAIAGPSITAAPNPARGPIRFSIDPARGAQNGRAILVYSVSGRRVARIAAAGGNAVWNGRDEAGHAVPSGVYFARFESEHSGSGTKFMLLH